MDEIRALPVGDLGLLVREVSFEITDGSSLQNDHLPNQTRSACSVDPATAKKLDWKERWEHDRERYRSHHQVENLLCGSKEFRSGIARRGWRGHGILISYWSECDMPTISNSTVHVHWSGSRWHDPHASPMTP